MASMGRTFLRQLPGIVRPIRVLWNEVIGFVFLVFAILAGWHSRAPYAKMQAGEEGALEFFISVCFMLMMAGFGLASFWKARKISRG